MTERKKIKYLDLEQKNIVIIHGFNLPKFVSKRKSYLYELGSIYFPFSWRLLLTLHHLPGPLL